MTIVQARPHQVAAVRDTGNAYRAGFLAPILVAPTGMGKTHCSSMIIGSVVQKQWRVLFLAHRQELIEQCSAKLRESGIAHGIIMAGRQPDRRHAVQVASVQTLINRLDRYDEFDLIVIDECHRSGASSYHKIVSHYQRKAAERLPTDPAYGRPVRLLGLTATPTRLDGKGLGVHVGGLFDVIVPTVTTRELIDLGYLVPYRYLEPSRIDKSGMHTRGGEWDQREADERICRPELVGKVSDHYAEHGPGRPALVFAQNLHHAGLIEEDFKARYGNFSICTVSAESDKNLRRNVLKDIASRQLNIAINVGLWIEGMDCPPVSYIALAMMTKSMSGFRQRTGRGFRTDEDKFDCIFADHGGNREEHGFPCIGIEWDLDGRPPRDMDSAPEYAIKRCPHCGAVCTARSRICDALLPSGRVCGTILVSVAPRVMQETDEKLVEANLAAVIEQERKRAELGRARSAEDLAKLAAERGYKPGYAGHVQQARDEKDRLRRELAELRLSQGDPTTGIHGMKPKALKAEIEERLLLQAQRDEEAIV